MKKRIQRRKEAKKFEKTSKQHNKEYTEGMRKARIRTFARVKKELDKVMEHVIANKKVPTWLDSLILNKIRPDLQYKAQTYWTKLLTEMVRRSIQKGDKVTAE
jgi:hypothetical protein